MDVRLENIHKSFASVHANDGVSLAVGGGEIHGLLGENGAGKTTLMKVLSGYLSPDAGQILLDGQEVTFESPAEAIAAGIGMLHQDPLDIPPMTVLENFQLGSGRRLFLDRDEARRRLLELSAQFGFELDPMEQVQALTVGERQQLEIVRLLALGIEVIILDEPTTGISGSQKELLFKTLHELCRDGLSVIFVSHKLEEVEALCSASTVLREGRVTGRMAAPFDTDQLVQDMFGRELTTVQSERVSLAEPVLTLEHVSVRTYRLQLEDISLCVRAGEVVGVAGLEGSGQHLLMRACAGLMHVLKGCIKVGDRDMTNHPYREYLRQGVVLVPAARLEEGMVPSLTLREHYALVGEPRGLFVDWDAAEAMARERIATHNIVGDPETPVQSLSGGNQQRAILSLLPDRLRLLLLEHPTRGLDLESVRWVWQQLLQRREQGSGILFTSTDLDELAEHSDRIVVFSGGNMSQPLDASQVTREELGYLIGGRGL